MTFQSIRPSIIIEAIASALIFIDLSCARSEKKLIQGQRNNISYDEDCLKPQFTCLFFAGYDVEILSEADSLSRTFAADAYDMRVKIVWLKRKIWWIIYPRFVSDNEIIGFYLLKNSSLNRPIKGDIIFDIRGSSRNEGVHTSIRVVSDTTDNNSPGRFDPPGFSTFGTCSRNHHRLFCPFLQTEGINSYRSRRNSSALLLKRLSIYNSISTSSLAQNSSQGTSPQFRVQNVSGKIGRSRKLVKQVSRCVGIRRSSATIATRIDRTWIRATSSSLLIRLTIMFSRFIETIQ